MTNETMMKEAPVWKLILKMSLPMIVVMLMQVIYNMADTFFVGQTGSAALVAGISLAAPVFTFTSGLNTLLGNGACTAISIALGQGDPDKVKKYSSFACWASLALGLLAGAAILLFLNPLAGLLGATAETAAHTTAYLRILALGTPITILGGVLGNVLRADGSAAGPMIAVIGGNLVNIALDALFILVFGWGASGAALATVLGNLVSLLCTLVMFLRKKSFSLSPRHFTLRPEISLRVLSLGLPMAAGLALQSVSGVFSNQLLVSYGSVAVAANKVAGMSGMLLGMLIMGVCMGVQPAVSYLFGAGENKRLKKLLRSTGVLSVLLGAVMAVGFFLARGAFMAAFLNDSAVVELGSLMVLGSVAAAPLAGLYQLCSVYLQGTGKVGFATVTALLQKGLVLVPVLYAMEAVFGLYGLVFAGAVADLISTAIACGLSLSWAGKLKKQPARGAITQLPRQAA